MRFERLERFGRCKRFERFEQIEQFEQFEHLKHCEGRPQRTAVRKGFRKGFALLSCCREVRG